MRFDAGEGVAINWLSGTVDIILYKFTWLNFNRILWYIMAILDEETQYHNILFFMSTLISKMYLK